MTLKNEKMEKFNFPLVDFAKHCQRDKGGFVAQHGGIALHWNIS